jgi:hypothetical protein
MKPADSRAAARVGPLSGSQLRALFLVASDAGLASEVERLLDTATAETTPVEELMRLKERAKALIEAAADTVEREEARLLYHAAVAAAFVRHGAAISGRPVVKQRALYERLADSWAGHPLGRLFRDAAARLVPDP